MTQFLKQKRSTNKAKFFFLFLIGVFITINLVSLFNGVYLFGRVIYIYLFILVVAWPYFFIDKYSGKYLLLMFFLLFYFMLFGMAELQYLMGFSDRFIYEPDNIKFQVDSIIVLGAFSFISGYFLISPKGKSKSAGYFVYDWDKKKAYWLGIISWLIGTWAFVVIFFEGDTGFIPPSIVSNLKNMAVMGVAILIYLKFKYEDKRAFVTVIVLIAFELILGFFANTKEVSFRIPLLYILVSYMFNGKFNKVFIGSLVIFIVVFFEFFNAYRLNVIQIRNQTPMQAVNNLQQSISIVMDTVTSGNKRTRLKTSFSSRINTRQYLSIIVAGLDKGIKTRDGETLYRYFYSFIPRMFWPGKPVLSIGNEFNNVFKISKSSLTFIPTTQLGEFYWNFRMPGVITGMFLMGMLLAFLSKAFDLSVNLNLPRLVVILAVVYMLCARFEATFALQYAKLTRALMALYLLNLFARNKRLNR